jgi:hypothetical protein
MHQDVVEAVRLAALLLGVATAVLTVAANEADGPSGTVGQAVSAELLSSCLIAAPLLPPSASCPKSLAFSPPTTA